MHANLMQRTITIYEWEMQQQTRGRREPSHQEEEGRAEKWRRSHDGASAASEDDGHCQT